jgi:hypothetical protein
MAPEKLSFTQLSRRQIKADFSGGTLSPMPDCFYCVRSINNTA